MFYKYVDNTLDIRCFNKDMYNGYVENIDDMGQLHGSRGGCALIPDKDKFEVIECCGICGEEISGFGNNADPINCDDVCEDCNIDVVIPLRIFFSGYCDGKLLLINTNNDVEIIKIDTNNTLKQLQTLLGGLVEVVPKEDDKYLYLVDEEGLFKNKELIWIGENLFDITVVGNIVVIPKEYFCKFQLINILQKDLKHLAKSSKMIMQGEKTLS